MKYWLLAILLLSIVFVVGCKQGVTGQAVKEQSTKCEDVQIPYTDAVLTYDSGSPMKYDLIEGEKRVGQTASGGVGLDQTFKITDPEIKENNVCWEFKYNVIYQNNLVIHENDAIQKHCYEGKDIEFKLNFVTVWDDNRLQKYRGDWEEFNEVREVINNDLLNSYNTDYKFQINFIKEPKIAYITKYKTEQKCVA